MDQNEYPRPSFDNGPYAKDKTWGIVIIVLSVLGICGGIALGGIGGAVGALGATGAAAAAQGGATRDAQAAAATAGAGGGMLMILGLFTVVSSVAQLIGGIGIMKSLRWGFLVTGGFAVLSVLAGLFRLPSSIIGLAISGVILYYCYSRLTGKLGSVPV